MISAVLNVVVRASDDERAAALRWAERRLAKSSLSRDDAAELLEGLRRGDKRKGGRDVRSTRPDGSLPSSAASSFAAALHTAPRGDHVGRKLPARHR